MMFQITLLAVMTATLVCGLPINHQETTSTDKTGLNNRHVRQAEEPTAETPITNLTSQHNSTADSTESIDEVAGIQGQNGCDTLQQALKKWHGSGRLPYSLRDMYPFFVYSEVYLNLDDFDATKSNTARQLSENACINIKRNLDRTVPSDSPCSWSYTCDYNPDRFPSYRIQTTSCTRRDSYPGVSSSTLQSLECNTRRLTFPVSVRDQNGCWTNRLTILDLGCECAFES